MKLSTALRRAAAQICDSDGCVWPDEMEAMVRKWYTMREFWRPLYTEHLVLSVLLLAEIAEGEGR